MKARSLLFSGLLLWAALFLLSSFRSVEPHQTVPAKMLGSWRGTTRYSSMYDPMFTMVLKPGGKWTDLTFGAAKAVQGKYTYNSKSAALTLYTAKGSVLYIFRHQPASGSEKERLVEQLPDNESYRAMVCYRYRSK